MAQYIDKEALVAEIERRNEKLIHTMNKIYYASNYNEWKSVAREYRSLISFLDTLEVKEVDLQEGTKTDWLQELKERLDSLSKEDFDNVWAKYKLREEGSVDYDKLNTMLDESLSKETKESWNERLGEEPVSEDLEKMSYHSAMDLINNPKFLPTTTFGELIPMLQKLYKDGAKWQKERIMANTVDATIGLPYENKDGGYTHLVDVSRPLPVGDNKIAIIFKEK